MENNGNISEGEISLELQLPNYHYEIGDATQLLIRMAAGFGEPASPQNLRFYRKWCPCLWLPFAGVNGNIDRKHS